MFGNAPKTVWERWIPADELNRIRLATRALSVILENEVLLFEAGIGAYMEPKYRERYGVEAAEHVLLKSLEQNGIAHTDVTHVVLSHLHFDHAGGLLSAWQEGKEPVLLFPNAKIHVGQEAWERASHPHSRDKASFAPLLIRLLENSRRLDLVKPDDVLSIAGLQVHFFQSDGHTPGMLCSDLRWDKQRLVFVADLIPGRPWLHLPITMGYDRFPELLINEKNALLSSVVEDRAWIFYTHDPEIAISRVQFDEEKKTFAAVDCHDTLDVLNTSL